MWQKDGEDGPLAKAVGMAIGLCIGLGAAAFLLHQVGEWRQTEPEEQTSAIQGVHHGTVVHDQHPRARIDISLDNGWGDATVLTFDVDTGFTGELCAPRSVIEEQLGLMPMGSEVYSMSDGWKTQVHLYRTNALWHGEARRVTICSGTTQLLLGMGMLENSVLTVDRAAGTVTISPARRR